MVILAIFAIGAVSASENITEVQAIDDDDAAGDSLELSADDGKIGAAVNDEDEPIAADEKDNLLGDGDTTTKNITVYSGANLLTLSISPLPKATISLSIT